MDENPSVDTTTTVSEPVVVPAEEQVVVEPELVVELAEEPKPEVVSREQYDLVHKRATKAEADLKALKGQPKPVTPASSVNVEETVLLAQGMSEELLGELKAVAQVRKISLIKAQADPIFVAVKEKFEKEKKNQDASLGTSRSSGNVKAKKDFNTPGLSREEHKQMFKQLS